MKHILIPRNNGNHHVESRGGCRKVDWNQNHSRIQGNHRVRQRWGGSTALLIQREKNARGLPHHEVSKLKVMLTIHIHWGSAARACRARREQHSANGKRRREQKRIPLRVCYNAEGSRLPTANVWCGPNDVLLRKVRLGVIGGIGIFVAYVHPTTGSVPVGGTGGDISGLVWPKVRGG